MKCIVKGKVDILTIIDSKLGKVDILNITESNLDSS